MITLIPISRRFAVNVPARFSANGPASELVRRVEELKIWVAEAVVQADGHGTLCLYFTAGPMVSESKIAEAIQSVLDSFNTKV